jgi:hypothetical protein
MASRSFALASSRPTPEPNRAPSIQNAKSAGDRGRYLVDSEVQPTQQAMYNLAPIGFIQNLVSTLRVAGNGGLEAR